jgi:DNA-binding MarR family transcriptional regulator
VDQSRAVAKAVNDPATDTRMADEPAAGTLPVSEPGCGTQAAADPAREETASRLVLTVLRLFRAMERVDAGLTPQQYRILKMAGAGGERSARLAERLAVAKPTLTATADGLVAAGYARRDAEPGDRRVVRLCLTPAGHDALQRADAAYCGWLDRLLGATSEADRILVLHSLNVLDAAMDDMRRARQDRR